jgi:hypothetical protein
MLSSVNCSRRHGARNAIALPQIKHQRQDDNREQSKQLASQPACPFGCIFAAARQRQCDQLAEKRNTRRGGKKSSSRCNDFLLRRAAGSDVMDEFERASMPALPVFNGFGRCA